MSIEYEIASALRRNACAIDEIRKRIRDASPRLLGDYLVLSHLDSALLLINVSAITLAPSPEEVVPPAIDLKTGKEIAW